jgi:hypothetical protein
MPEVIIWSSFLYVSITRGVLIIRITLFYLFADTSKTKTKLYKNNYLFHLHNVGKVPSLAVAYYYSVKCKTTSYFMNHSYKYKLDSQAYLGILHKLNL